jgi:RNA-directed DNA polymerase
MNESQREIIRKFRQKNTEAGCDPIIIDLCLSYLRHCFSVGQTYDFTDLQPSVTKMLKDPDLTANRRKYLLSIKKHLWKEQQLPTHFLHLNLWYYYNLLKMGLPTLFTIEDLAKRLEISCQALHYIASKGFPGYIEFFINKRNGGKRKISAPVPKLRWIQRWILDNILSKLPVEKHAMAYLEGRSIIDNASPHIMSKIVVNLDLSDFFPSIDFRRILGLFLSTGYLYPVAMLLTKLSCHNGKLPQGAPTSPAISNITCRKLDRRLAGLAESMGFAYSRYADDITFSGDIRPDGLIRSAKKIIADEGFSPAESKTRITRRGNSQRVTGLVVNEKPNLPRKYRRRIRAIIYNCQRFGAASQNRDNHPDFKAHLYGHVHFINSINPHTGARMLQELEKIDWNS